MNVSADDLTGFEMLEVKKTLGCSLEKADNIEAAYALTYVFKRRENPAFTYNDTLALTLREVLDFVGLNDDEDDEPAMPFDVDDNDPKD